MNKIDISQKIRVMLAYENLNVSSLSKLINTSQQNLSAKLKRNNFSTNEMEEIADALGYTLKIEFIKKESTQK